MWIQIQRARVFVPGASVAAPARKPPMPSGRYTRFGFRIGSADGPWRMRDAGSPPRLLVKNPEEQAIMARIVAECDGSGRSATALAKNSP